jgi:hypothetical protein
MRVEMSLDTKPNVQSRASEKDAVISIGNGITLTAEELQAVVREGAENMEYNEAKRFLGDPSILLKNPRKGAHYAFPIRDSRTAGICRSGVYKVVPSEELKEDCPFDVSVRGKQIEWENHILVEISDEVYHQRFIVPQWRNTVQLAHLREHLAARAATQHLPIQTDVSKAHNPVEISA